MARYFQLPANTAKISTKKLAGLGVGGGRDWPRDITYKEKVLWVRIHWIWIWIWVQNFKWILIRIRIRFRKRIHGFDDQRLKKIQLKFFFFLFWSKISIYLSLGFIKDVEATGEAFSPQKQTSSTLKKWTFKAVFYFSAPFLLSWIRTLIANPSESTTLRKRMKIFGEDVLLVAS